MGFLIYLSTVVIAFFVVVGVIHRNWLKKDAKRGRVMHMDFDETLRLCGMSLLTAVFWPISLLIVAGYVAVHGLHKNLNKVAEVSGEHLIKKYAARRLALENKK